jgi:hypothetical protein
VDERTIIWKEFGKTLLDPLSLTGTLLAGVTMLFLPRRYALVPFVAVCCLLPIDQRLVIAGADFNMVRILLVFGWLRILVRGEAGTIQWQRIDTCFALWMLASTVTHVLREKTTGELIWRLGATFEAAGTYYLVRGLVRTPADLRGMTIGLAALMLPFALALTIEHHTGRNLFSVFGGVPELTMVREGKLRCQGAFPHPILTGDLGAMVLPLALGLAFTSAAIRPLACAAVLASAVIVWLSASSGPLLAALGAVLAWALWSQRWRMFVVRRSIVALLCLLQLVMNHPIWFLFAIIGVVGGSTGYHRYILIDAFVNNAREWFLIGTPSTAHWGWGLQDITNHFVLEGVRGGIASLVAFVAMFVYAFKAVGVSMWSLRSVAHGDARARRGGWFHLIWGFGASLVAHLLAMTGVSYFDQMLILFFVTLGAVASAQQAFARAARLARVRRPASEPAAAREAAPETGPARGPGLGSIFGVGKTAP